MDDSSVISTKDPQIKRENAKIHPDIIASFKILAALRGQKLYEVMEKPLKEYLERPEIAELLGKMKRA